MSPVEADVHNVAARIRQIYREEKAQQIGKPYRPHKRFDELKTWLTAAENCIAAGADPYAYVRAAFMFGTVVPGGPFPNQLCSKAAVRWYRDYEQTLSKFRQPGESVFASEVRGLLKFAISEAIQRQKRFHDFFLDPSVPLDLIPAFVRVVLLPNDPMVVEKWGRKAYQEVMGNQHLLNTLVEMKCDLRFIERFKT